MFFFENWIILVARNFWLDNFLLRLYKHIHIFFLHTLRSYKDYDDDDDDEGSNWLYTFSSNMLVEQHKKFLFSHQPTSFFFPFCVFNVICFLITPSLIDEKKEAKVIEGQKWLSLSLSLSKCQVGDIIKKIFTFSINKHFEGA